MRIESAIKEVISWRKHSSATVTL